MFTLKRSQTGLLVIDVQEKLLKPMFGKKEVLSRIVTAIEGFSILERPIVVTEQYSKGLGGTVSEVRKAVGEGFDPIEKTTFSAWGTKAFADLMRATPVQQWVIVGLETHICTLMTAKDFVANGKQVLVVGDATTARKESDHLMALSELRHSGCRVGSLESVLFELLGDAADDSFKAISQLVK